MAFAKKEPKEKKIHQTKGDIIFDIVNNTLLTILLVIILYPLIYVVSCSISDPLLVVQSKILLFPQKITGIAYERVFRNDLIMSGYANSIKYTLIGTTVNVFLTIITAYPLAQRDFKARTPITMLFTFTMLFSGGLVPTFLTVQKLGLVNKIGALILPSAISAWNLFIMKNYFQSSIPEGLYEAARIDGADHFTILVRLVIPLSVPIIAVMVLYYGVAHWNSYFDALIYLRDRYRYPLQLVMRSFFTSADYAEQGSSGGDDATQVLLVGETMKYALIVVASLPMLCLYPMIQRYFVKCVMIGAIKG